MTNLSDTFKGALLMMGAMAGFVFNDAAMRSVLADIPLFQAIFLRGAGLTLILAVLAWRRGVFGKPVAQADRTRIYIRSSCEVVGTFAFLTALTALPFANISAIMQAVPLCVTLAAALFLGAPIGWRRILAILVGFAGVLIIVRPGTDDFSVASLLVLFVVGMVTMRDLISRTLSVSVPSLAVALNAAVLMTVVTGVLMFFEPRAEVSWHHVGLIAAASTILSVGYICSVAAMRIGDIATIAPMRYTSLLWSILIGMVMFSEVPDAWTLVGAAIIVAMGVFSFYREGRAMRGHAKR